MKKYSSIFSLIGLAVMIISCGENSSSSTGGVEVDLDDAIAQAEGRRAANPDEMGGNSCLLAFQTKYDELLAKEMVLAATGFSEEVLEVKYSKALKDPVYHSFTYRFANKRVGKIKGLDFESELRDEVMIKSIKPMSLNQFQQVYRIPTQEETNLGNQSIDDAIAGKSESEEANEKMAELEEKGVSKETTQGAADLMKETFSNVANSYMKVEDLGDAATWNSFTNSLNVLQNGVQFELLVNVSNDEERNKSTAIAVAKKILALCD